MNNRYFGNIHDFCKYGLLRYMARNCGLHLGVCWMLTPGIGKPEGSGYEYMDSAKLNYQLRLCDRDLFCWLMQKRERLQQKEATEKWGVGMLEADGIIPDATYYGLKMPRVFGEREEYFRNMRNQFKYQQGPNRKDVVFLDPDFGMGFNAREFASERGNGYLHTEDVAKCLHAGFSVLFYQDWHRDWGDQFDIGREVRGALRDGDIREPIVDLEVDASLAGNHPESGKICARFFLIQHRDHSAKIGQFLESFRASHWCKKGVFSIPRARIGVFMDFENAASYGMSSFECAFRTAMSLGEVRQFRAAGKEKSEYQKYRAFLSTEGIDVPLVEKGKNKADLFLLAAIVEMAARHEVDEIVVVGDDGDFLPAVKWARKKRIRYTGIGRNPQKGYCEECDRFCFVEEGKIVRWQTREESKNG